MSGKLGRGKTSLPLDLVELKRLYLEEGLSLANVAKRLDCCNETVRKRLKGMGIRAVRRVHEQNLKLPDTETAWAYLAGLVDGEGSIVFTRRRAGRRLLYPILQVVNTRIEVMEWLVRNFGGSYYTYKGRTNPLIHSHVNMSCWKVTRIANLALLLPRIEPYLVIKRDKACLAIKMCRMYNIHEAPGRRAETIKRPNYHVVVGE